MCQLFEFHALISNGHIQTIGHGQVGTRRVQNIADTYAERLSKAWGHQTHTTERTLSVRSLTQRALQMRRDTELTPPDAPLSVRCSQSEAPVEVRQNTRRVNSVWPPSDAEHPMLPSPLLETRAHRTRRSSIQCLQGQRLVSIFPVKNTPVTSPNFPPT